MDSRQVLLSLLAVQVASASWLACVEAQESPTLRGFRVRDYGAVADSRHDAGPGIRAAIAAAVQVGAPAEVVLEAGVYRIGAGPEGEYALTIAGASHLVIRGQGRATELIVTDPEMGGIRLSECESVRVSGVVLDYDPAPYAQGTVTAVDAAEGAFTLDVDEGYLEPNHRAFANAKARWGIIVRPGSDSRQPVYGSIVVPAIAEARIESRQWRLQVAGPPPGGAQPLRATRMQPGDRYVHLARNYAAAVAGIRCRNLVVEDVTVYASPGISFLPYLCGRVVIRNCRVARRPGSDRLLSTNADGVHCRGSRRGIVVESCDFEGMADDAINIHSSPIPVMKVISPTEVVVRKYHYTLRLGDRLEVMDSAACRVRGQVVAREVTEIDGEWAYRVRFDRPIEGIRAGARFDDADNLYNLSECAEGSVVRNCHFRSFRGRGVLLSSRGCVVEENTFDVSEGWGVVLYHESTRWGEGPLAQGIIVRNNIFRGHGGYQSSIFTFASRRDGRLADSREMRGLVILGNRFLELGAPAIELHSCRDVRLEDNSITTSASAHRPRPSYASLIVDNCTGIVVRGLDVRDTDPRHRSAILISESTAAGEAGVSITDVRTELAPASAPVVDRRPD